MTTVALLSSLSLVAGRFLRAGSRAGPDCARPTRAFSGRALREQWNGPAALPILSSHRPPLLVPRHLPEHPLISRADHERLLHPPLLFFARRLGPLIYFAPHPALHLGKFR